MEIPARHPKKGDCIIRKPLNALGRIRVLVDYPALGIRGATEFLEELRDPVTGKPILLPGASPPPEARKAPSLPWHRARQALLALRLGQSTPETVRELSVGLSEVEDACRWALDRAASGQLTFLLFRSPYGMGKSHALAYLRQAALARQMAAATVVLDGIGVTLTKPLGVVTALAHAVELPGADPGEGLPQRLAQLVRERAVSRLRAAGAHMLYEGLAALRPEHAEDPEEWEAYEDYLSLDLSATAARQRLGARLPSLAARSKADRPDRAAMLLREWAQACTVVGARNGLVLSLDELDVDYGNRWITRDEAEQRWLLLQAWQRMAETGPRGNGYAQLVIAMAIAPVEPDPIRDLQDLFGTHLRTVPLRPLRESDMLELGRRVCRLYRAAYQMDDGEPKGMDALVSEALEPEMEGAQEPNPRQFIRRLLEKLDVAYA